MAIFQHAFSCGVRKRFNNFLAGEIFFRSKFMLDVSSIDGSEPDYESFIHSKAIKFGKRAPFFNIFKIFFIKNTDLAKETLPRNTRII
uniref:Uncharacterized protein n=1 Tax=Romanomermis culicivorax TaxID=13658 RepID=A0A915K4U0_ROMCU